ncbi:hypothetical protein QYM36_016008 [Artemia franciscana]|uniref:Uncharacterized protein n=1 Tax=Artemia franciscana TaxID=6661 RepID=A0AA88KXR1_ARTSF|nr:hypothetical protein QYM36_016008 [Artemia franciscana]
MTPNHLKLLHLKCLAFIVEFVLLIQKKNDHNNPSLKAFACLGPEVALEGRLDTVVGLPAVSHTVLGNQNQTLVTKLVETLQDWTILS